MAVCKKCLTKKKYIEYRVEGQNFMSSSSWPGPLNMTHLLNVLAASLVVKVRQSLILTGLF